jgi:hypothetical protein
MALRPHTDNINFLIKCTCISNALSGLNYTTNTSNTHNQDIHPQVSATTYHTTRYTNHTHQSHTTSALPTDTVTYQRPAKLATPTPNTTRHRCKGATTPRAPRPTHPGRSLNSTQLEPAVLSHVTELVSLHPLTYYPYSINSFGLIFVSPNLLHLLPS